MTCYHPIAAWQPIDPVFKKPKGDRLVFNPDDPRYAPGSLKPIKVSCGQCVGCRLNRSGEWAARIAAEAQLYEHNSYLTLTYDDEHLPENGQLLTRDIQLFFKRLRKRYKGHQEVMGANPKQPFQIRYMVGAEYGDQNSRPHFHVCLLNFEFHDKKLLTKNKHGQPLYTSKRLTALWGKGHANFGELTYDSAAYVARYCMKKVTGDMAEQNYERTNLETGEIYQLKPEFNLMSRKPAIGVPWLMKYQSDVYSKPVHNGYRKDSIQLDKMNGKVVRRPPRSFDRFLEKTHPDLFEEIKEYRERELIESQLANPLEFTPERLAVKEKLKRAQIIEFKRDSTCLTTKSTLTIN
jgi:hypothetical protein